MQKNSPVEIGLIPAAGTGARLGYLSNLLPKTLFPIYDRPILHHIINLMESVKIREIYIIVNVHKDKIIEYCKKVRKDLKVNIHFIEQKELNGTANAILLAERYIREPFLTILGDEYLPGDLLPDILEFFYTKNCIALEAAIKEKNKIILQQTCCVNIAEDNRIIQIIEKPQNPLYNLRGCGIYVFKPEIFGFIKKTAPNPIRKEKDITTVIDMVAKNNQAYAYVLSGSNFNINNADELLKASNFARRNLKNID